MSPLILNHPPFILFEQCLPLYFVVFYVLQIRLQIDDLRGRSERRRDDDIQEAHLRLRHIHCQPIHQVADGLPTLPLNVTLPEELNEEKVGPATAHLPWLGCVGNVRKVEHHR